MSYLSLRNTSARQFRMLAQASNASNSNLLTGGQVTHDIVRDRDVQQIASSFNSMNLPPGASGQTWRPLLDQYEHSTVPQRRRTDWNDLPMEILVHIAKETIVPRESTANDQFPHLDEIETTFCAIDKRARQAFFHAIRQDCVFIRLQFYNAPSSAVDSKFTIALQRYFSSQRSVTLLNASIASGYEPSSIRMRFQDNMDICVGCTANIVIYATPWNVTLMRAFLVAQRNIYRNLIIDCHSSTQSSVKRIQTIVQETERTTRGMVYAGIFSDSNAMLLTSASTLSMRMMKTLDYPAMLAIHENHLLSIQEAMRYKKIQTILPYAADAALDHIRCFGSLHVLYYADTRVARQRTLYITLVLKGFSAYLLLQPNTREHQSHCLLVNRSHGDTLLRECLKCTKVAKALLDRFGWRYRNKNVEVLLQAVFSMLQSRAEYELALARTATLPDSFKISSHVQRNEDHPLGTLDVDDHVLSSNEMRSTLRQIYEARLGNGSELSPDLILYQKWSDMMTTLTFETELAIVRPQDEIQKGGILVDPIPQVYVESLQYAWLFPDDDG